MSRIRSIHPGLFTDPEFVQVSMPARMLLLGLWTEADDRGVFEWKPLALKIKLFPVDNVDLVELLAELVAANRVRKVENGGKAYGLCRNFCRYQRPKNPSEGHAFRLDWALYVDLRPQDHRFKDIPLPQEGDSPPPVQPQEGVKTPPDGEERREEEEERKKEPAPVGARALEIEFEDFWKPYPKKSDRGHAFKAFKAVRKSGVDLQAMISGAERYRDDPKRDPQFTKNAATWLTGQCWLDEPAASPPSGKPDEKPMTPQERAGFLMRSAEKIKKTGYPLSYVRKPDMEEMISLKFITRDQLVDAGCEI